MSDFNAEQAVPSDPEESNPNHELQIAGWFVGDGVYMDTKEVDGLIDFLGSFTEPDEYTIWLNAKRDSAEPAQTNDVTAPDQPPVVSFTLDDLPVLLQIYAVRLMMLLDDIDFESGEEPDQIKRRALKIKEYQREKTIRDSLYNFIRLPD
jgi:hypothetical protein